MEQVLKPTPDVKITVQIEVEYTVPAARALDAYGTTDAAEMATIDAETWSDPLNLTELILGLDEVFPGSTFVSTTVKGEAI